MTPEYVAGFFDGEGCVSSYISRRSIRKRGTPCPHLSMAQKDPAVLIEIREFLGYGVVWKNRLTIRGKKNVLHFAEHIGPHLRVKHRQVALARLMAQRVGNDNSPTNPTYRRQRELLAEEIRRCNHGGV